MSQNPIFTTSFFKSLTNPFKLQHSVTNADRLNFDLSTITADLFQQELLHKLRSGSSQSRQQIIDSEILYSLSNFEPTVIPDVWYLTKDLIAPTVSSNTVKRSALNLLLSCINVQNQESTAFYIYFNDVLTNCNITKDKIDVNLDLIVRILKALTDEGRFIHHYQEPFKEPLLDFFLEVISKTNDFLKQKTLVLDFLDFIIESIKSGILDSISTDDESHLIILINSIIKLSLKTSDRLILEKCLNVIDTIIIYKYIPEPLLYSVLEILSGSSILDLSFLDLSTDIVSHIVDSTKIELILNTLNDILLCKSSKSSNDKNINASTGSLKIFKFLALKFVYKIDFQHLLNSLNEILSWDKNTSTISVLQFLQELLLDPSILSQINSLPIWEAENTDHITILALLENISTKLNNETSTLNQDFKTILISLSSLAESSQYPGTLKHLVEFFMKVPNDLSTNTCQFIISFYKVENLCSPLNQNWENNIQNLIDHFYLDNSKDLNVRIAVLRLIKEVFDSSLNTFNEDNELKEERLFKIASFLLSNLKLEDNTDILVLLGDYLVDMTSSISIVLFDKILNVHIRPGFSLINSETRSDRRASIPSLLLSANLSENLKSFNQKTMKVLLKSYVKIFANSLQSDGLKCSKTYDFLIKVAHASINKKNVDLLLIASRLLVRIRATMQNKIYLTNPIDMDGLSAAFARNLNIRKMDNISNINSPNTIPSTDLKRNNSKNAGTLDEKWTYPEEISYIPNDALDKPSEFLSVYSDDLSNKIIINRKEKSVIYIDQWLNLVIQIIEQCPHWENYSFIYTHFCPQFSNLKLFESVYCTEGIKRFRSVVCDQLMLKLPSNLKIPSTSNSSSNLTNVSQISGVSTSPNLSVNTNSTVEQISRHDLQVAIIRNFTPLISYHSLFSKQEQDQIISALLEGLSSWEKTAIPCVHILTICCYEIPLSIKKFLNILVTKLQTRISSPYATSHILEFLLVLSFQPQLTSNFTVDEFKRAFGICFKFIQYAHDIKVVKENIHQGILNHGEQLEAEFRPSTEFSEISPVISIYLLNLAYDVIANWFLNMKLKDRRKLSSFIIKNLIISQSNHGQDSINLQNLSFIDLITRFTYSDLELKFNKIKTSDEHFQALDSEAILSSKWSIGNGIISIDTHPSTGESLVSIRRASGSSVFTVIPDESMVPYYTDQLHRITSEDEPDDIFSENYMLLQLIVQADQNNTSKPIPIPKESNFIRSLANIDRIPVVQFHKVGLMYIGPNQKTETEILLNEKGSEEYDIFLGKLGRLIKLKDCKSFYVGGLDTENNADGEYALGWNDKILQIVFHATTMMPNYSDKVTADQQLSFKKRHIGNDYVNIFFDESGLAFDFNTIKSQFNFLNIVIQPHSISSPDAKDDSTNRKYKVKIHRRSGAPALFAACHFKIISEENLPTFIRTVSIIANQFAQVWHSNGNYESNWSHRMKSILSIKEKSIKFQEDLKAKQKSSTDTNDNEEKKQTGTGQSFLDQLNSEPSTSTTESSSGGLARSASISRAKNTNHYEFVDSYDNEFFKNLEFNSFTK